MTQSGRSKKELRMRNLHIAAAMLGVAHFVPTVLLGAEYTAPEDVSLSIIQQEQLLEIALTPTCCESVSSDLLAAMKAGEIDKITATRFGSKPTEGEPGYPTDQWTPSHFGKVFFKAASLSENRKFQPKVVCSSDGNQVWFDHCYDDSYIRVKAEWMERPIRLEGDIGDNDIELLYAAVDNAKLVSRTDGQIVTPNKIYSIIKYDHAGNRVNAYVTTARDGYTDVVYFSRENDENGSAKFVVSDFRCGVD